MAHIETLYKTDGTLVRAPKGFGGTLCHKATAPYEARQGATEKHATPEAKEPSILEASSSYQQKVQE